jgi:hypothetical protein
MKKQDNRQRLFEVMQRLDKSFKPKENLQEWNFDKKKGEDDDDKKVKKFEKEENMESKEHEESETPDEEKEEHKEKEELDENKPKVPVNAIAKVGK